MFGWLRKRKDKAIARPAEPAPAIADDLSLRLLQGEWRCSSCEDLHRGLMDLAAHAPDAWPHERSYEPNGALRYDGDFLSEDLCVIGGKNFLVRSVLEIPVQIGRASCRERVCT